MMVVVTTRMLVVVTMRMVVVEIELMCRKAAIPVPGPIGGGSLSDWKEEADSKEDSKTGGK